ncbi:MAG TPA: alcohol dehydrogenase catalytic domain-containing protein [Actinomycetes bacterium]|nr:alcohol dehydrogenase catalytic domain-containing protein [Actinomycetes bacterium]
MRQAVLTEPRRFTIADVPPPSIGPGDVLLRVAACGVCASELDIYQGAAGHAVYPWHPGHEVSGVVDQVGERVAGLGPGDPVAVWVTAGGYGEYVAVPAEHCLPAGDVPLELASLAEPLACAVNAVELAGIRLGDDVVIVGAGFMGQLIQRLVQLRGPRRVMVADTRDDALARAAAAGATATVNPATGDLAEAVLDATGGAGADVTIEITGTQGALAAIGACTRMSGTLVIAGYHQGRPRQVPLADWNWNGFRIANAHFREQATILGGMRAGMRLVSSGRLSLEGLVTHRFPLATIDQAFRTAIEKPEGYVKATVTP